MKQAENNDVDIVNTQTIDKTLDIILAKINKASISLKLINSVDELEDVINIIINENKGTIEKITYKIPGFKEPLVRNINISDINSAAKFIEKINENQEKKEHLIKLYELSDYRDTVICAPNQEKLDNIIKELNEKGYVLNE